MTCAWCGTKLFEHCVHVNGRQTFCGFPCEAQMFAHLWVSMREGCGKKPLDVPKWVQECFVEGFPPWAEKPGR
jgi:hypothetical protein